MIDPSRYIRHGANHNGSDEWRTPPKVFKILTNEFNFTHDLAATKTNTLCDNYFVDSLGVSWKGIQAAFCNPPFSMAEEFLQKAHEPDLTVFVIPARPQTKYFIKNVMLNDYTHEIRWCHRGMRFVPPAGVQRKISRAPLPVVVVVYRNTKRTHEIRQTVICSDTLLQLGVIAKGNKTRGRQTIYDMDQIDSISRLWEKGTTNIRELAALTSIPRSTVHRIVQKLNV